jgi:hypothetical protein
VNYQKYVLGNLPRIDLVTQKLSGNTQLKAIEIKLTALPDNSTCEGPENNFGCEIVVRPDTIVYLAVSIASLFDNSIENLKRLIGNRLVKIKDWTDGNTIIPYLPHFCDILDNILKFNINGQIPFVMQPIWKTNGKSTILSDNCFDIFVWSNFAFTRLFLKTAIEDLKHVKIITRELRTIIWLIKMLIEFSQGKNIPHKKIIDELSYNTKNDKAFAISGARSRPFMNSPILLKPRILKNELKYIILGGGQNLLSPERRLDAIIQNSPDLFR